MLCLGKVGLIEKRGGVPTLAKYYNESVLGMVWVKYGVYEPKFEKKDGQRREVLAVVESCASVTGTP